MNRGCLLNIISWLVALAAVPGAHEESRKPSEPAVSYFKVDPATAGTLTGRFSSPGKDRPKQKIDMDEDPQCARLHKGAQVSDESLVVNPKGALANVFVYIKAVSKARRFEPPATPVTIDQNGCWFQAARHRHTNRPDLEGDQLRSGYAQHPSAGAGESRMEPQPVTGRSSAGAPVRSPGDHDSR